MQKLVELKMGFKTHNGGIGGPISMSRLMDHLRLIVQIGELPQYIELKTADGKTVRIQEDEGDGNLRIEIL